MKRWEIRGLTSKRVRVFDPDEVTARGAPEADPGSVGLGRDDVESIWSAVVDFYKTGFHPALGLCIRRRGEVILDRTIGHARGNSPDDPEGTPLVRATPKTLFNFFSGSKAVTAMLIHLLAERDQLHVDEPVATFIPEFARNRKQRITIRDLLTHRAGIPETPAQVADLDMLQDPQRILEMLYELEPTYRPGTVPAYHAVTSGFIFAELIQRVSGVGIREFLRREISEPLGTSHFNYGVPEERLDEVAIDACTGPKLIWPLKDIFEKALGVSIEELIDISNDPRFRTGIIPSANLIATPDDICRFFELLVAGGTFEGTRVFAEDTVRRATELQTAGQIDRMLLLPVSYSMGFMLGTEPVGLYGIRCGKAFGHVGLSNILAWADPERDIAVALLNSGKPFVAVDTYHWLNIVRLISTRIPRDGSKRFVI
ncbi:MAG: beta-lactamase family protein [Deltaproteobacteria bacterium]|nr:beta-lactamase family protein [Deltaproteobacteria bacterium]MBW2379928.1 beta-lactamase family protein [Deltaproteobacteria bacterium]